MGGRGFAGCRRAHMAFAEEANRSESVSFDGKGICLQPRPHVLEEIERLYRDSRDWMGSRGPFAGKWTLPGGKEADSPASEQGDVCFDDRVYLRMPWCRWSKPCRGLENQRARLLGRETESIESWRDSLRS